MSGFDVFSQHYKQPFGPFSGFYLWNSPANWTLGSPTDGDNVMSTATGFDNISSLDLDTLDITGGSVWVVASSLQVATLEGGANDTLGADASEEGAPVAVTASQITGSGAKYVAEGQGALFLDKSTTDSGNAYDVEDGGTLEFSPRPNSESSFDYSSGSGTIAFENPGATVSSAIENVSIGDVLELPGTSVSSVVFEPNGIQVVTSAGAYDFENVGYVNTISSFVVDLDANTGLEAITLGVLDVFEENSKATSGPFDGYYLWGTAANWVSDALPVDGDSVDAVGEGFDNISSLDLDELKLSGASAVVVTGSDLTVSTIAGAADTYFSANANTADAPVSVTVDSITGSGASYAAYGVGAVFVLYSATSPGNTYVAGGGGLSELPLDVEIDNTLFYEGIGTIAFATSFQEISSAIEDLGEGDTLEVPLISVSLVDIGSNYVQIAGDGGEYYFTDVSYFEPLTTWVASYDSETGLEAVTFGVILTFEAETALTSGPFKGYFSWSSDAWSDYALPVNGDSVVDSAGSGDGVVDDISSLDLDSLTLSNLGVYVTGSQLKVATVYGGQGFTLVADAELSEANAVTVTVGAIGGIGGQYGAIGLDATFIDNATSDAGNTYSVGDDGLFIFSAIPNSLSQFVFFDDNGILALRDPGSTVASALVGVAIDDTLELPGTLVTSATFGANSFSIVTNQGRTTFSNVSFSDTDGLSVNGFIAYADTTTGLEAVTFGIGGSYPFLLTNQPQKAIFDIDNASFLLSGGGNTIDFIGGPDNEALLYETDSNWDSVSGSSGTVYLALGQAEVTGGGDTVYFSGVTGNAATLSDTNENWDSVRGANGILYLESAQAEITDGADTVNFQNGSGNAVTLTNPADGWYSVNGSAGAIYLEGAQAVVTGGGDTVDFYSGTGNAVTLTTAGGIWYSVNGSDGTIYLSGGQAAVSGGGDTVDFYAGTGNAVTLSADGGAWYSVNGSDGTVYLDSGQAAVTGGGDTVSFYGGAGNAVTLSNTSGNWDAVNGSDGTIYLNSGQGVVTGGGDTVNFYGGTGNAVTLSNTAENWDTVNGSSGVVYLTAAQAGVSGGGDTVNLYGGANNAVTLSNTSGDWDAVNGSAGSIYLVGAQAGVTGSSDTIQFQGTSSLAVSGASDAFVFEPKIGGADTISGFASSDSLQFNASDFANWTALQSHMAQSGANTLITLDAAHTVTLEGVTASNLTSSQFHFV